MNTGLSRRTQQKKIRQAEVPHGVQDCAVELEVPELIEKHQPEDAAKDWEAEQPPYYHRDIF